MNAHEEPSHHDRPVPQPETDLEARRLRTARRAVVVGAALGVAAAGGVAATGAGGAVGLTTLLLVWAVTAVAVGLQVLVVGFVDDLRRWPVTRRRLFVALGLLLAGFVLLVMAFGAAS